MDNFGAASSEQVESILRRFESAVTERGTWDNHWEETARIVLPHYSRTFKSNLSNTPGEKKNQDMFDSTAMLALQKFAAAMESMLTPRNSRWHRLVPQDRGLLKNRQVMMWFEDATDKLFEYRNSPRSNFQSNQHEIYMALGAFGTGCLFIDKLDGGGIRYKAIHLAEIYFFENHQGIIDTAMRRFKMTARQAAQKWGVNKLSDKIKTALENKPDQHFYFLHVVMPREVYDPNKLDGKNMKWASHYIEIDGRVQMSEGGYSSFPYAISRYVLAPGETYGRSPAMMVLPAIKVINEQKRTVLKQGQRVVDPVLLAFDDGVIDTARMLPGRVNLGGVSADGKPLVHALPTGNLALAKEMMEAERATINDAFLITLFQILIDSPTMTATEVLERAREKGALLSPTMGRQQSESLGPLIEREIDVLSEQQLLPQMPAMLRQAGGIYKVEYDSPLSRAQKAEEASGLMRTVEFLTGIISITQDPSALDFVDLDVAVPELLYINAAPTRWTRTLEDVQALRKQRDQAKKAQQLMDAAPAAAGIMSASKKAA